MPQIDESHGTSPAIVQFLRESQALGKTGERTLRVILIDSQETTLDQYIHHLQLVSRGAQYLETLFLQRRCLFVISQIPRQPTCRGHRLDPQLLRRMFAVHQQAFQPFAPFTQIATFPPENS